ncbi:hypothetical protein [Streptomyces sp. NPDC088915]|uniref:hypothetical protein n=1 Tax=Streptomyces sp. NPDC088915 TaxID=3365912 RepID=UPI00382B72D8
MSSLPYTVVQPLQIPDAAYNGDGIATLVVTGTSYGGIWVLNAISTHVPPDGAESIGEIETEAAPRQPDRALEAAQDWVRTTCDEMGIALGHFKDLNSHYGPDEAPFFTGGQFLIDRRPPAAE